MSGVRRLVLAGLTAAFAALPADAQEPVSSFSLGAHGGLINDPAGYDADRIVSYGMGVRFGATANLQLYERISVRGDVSLTSKSGTDTSGGINESVDLGRQFYGAGVEVLLMTGGSMEPYVHAGGGLVVVDRQGQELNSYAYDVTEFTGVVGGGVRLLLESNAFVFADVTTWTYQNHIVDESNLDTSFSVGFGYRWGG
jgi:hypothetical protein